MSQPRSDALLPDDEFLAACREIEALADRTDAEAKPESSTASSDTPAGVSPPTTPAAKEAPESAGEPEPAATAGPSDLSAGGPAPEALPVEPPTSADAEHPSTAEPAASQTQARKAECTEARSRNRLLDEEMTAALAAFESMSPEDLAAIPSLDPEPQPDAAPQVPPAAAETPVPAKKTLQFKVGLAASAPSQSKAPTGRADAPSRAGASRPQAALWKRIYRVMDDALERANRPIQRRIPRHTRNLIGHVAVVTLGVSLLAAWLLPWLLPPHDAVAFVETKREVLERQQAESAQTAPPDTGQAANDGNDA